MQLSLTSLARTGHARYSRAQPGLTTIFSAVFAMATLLAVPAAARCDGTV